MTRFDPLPLSSAMTCAAPLLCACGGPGAGDSPPPASAKGACAPLTVTLATVRQRDLSFQSIANSIVVSMQSTDIRAQTTSTVKAIQIAEDNKELLQDRLKRQCEINVAMSDAEWKWFDVQRKLDALDAEPAAISST